MKRPVRKKPVPKPRKATPKAHKALARRDTPVDMPLVPHATAPRPLGPPASSAGGSVLERLAMSQGIEAGYEVWQELREHHRAALARLADERRKLEHQGEFVLGAVRAVRDGGAQPGSEALTVTGGGLDAFLSDASQQLEAAKRELEAAAQASNEKWQTSFEQVRQDVLGRVTRTLKLAPPKLRLRLRALSADQRILHVDRPGPDESVLLCLLFTGKLPSRYGYLFDDSTDDLRTAPPQLYPDEGVAPDAVRPDPDALTALLKGPHPVLPVKGLLPFEVVTLSGVSLTARLVERGPVMEAEVADLLAFRNVLTRDEAERIAGYLLKLKLEGKLQLELLAE